MLTAIIDSEILNDNDSEKEDLLRIIINSNRTFSKILRTECRTNLCDLVKNISSISEISQPDIDLNSIYTSLRFRPKNKCQEQFFYSMIKYANHTKDNIDYIHNLVFITENRIFF